MGQREYEFLLLQAIMVEKRPIVEDDLYMVSSKYPKFEDNGQQFSVSGFSSEDAPWKHYNSGKGDDGYTSRDEDSKTCNVPGLRSNFTDYSSGGNSNISGASSCTSEEDLRAKAPNLASPENDDFDYPSRTLAHGWDSYGYLLELPPKKLVTIGPEFQAEIPEWCPDSAIDTPRDSCSAGTTILRPQTSRIRDDLDVANKFSGTCVSPMPSIESIACDDDAKGGSGKIVCACVDRGSVTCVRQHIFEARNGLMKMVGHNSFTGLGLHETGEVVAEKWSNEDEELFEDVIISNPEREGQNFWSCLSKVFPSHTKMEIVSYYFNVFMLRKRASQNRSKSLNIDSDDDEWQESDDELLNSDGSESEEDEDSVVAAESPACQGIPGWRRMCNDSHEYGTRAVKDACHQYKADVASGLDGVYGVSKTWPPNYYGTDPAVSLSHKTLLDVWGDNDLTHHPNTSDTGTELLASKLKADLNKTFASTCSGVSTKGGDDFYLEPCHAKVWDFGYATRPRKNDVEFFPTCNVIEEVFGVEDSYNKTKDDKLL